MVYGATGGGDPLFGLLRQEVVPNRFHPGVPLDFTVSPIDELYVGARTGFGMIDLTSNSGIDPGDAVFLPLGLSAGVNIPIDRAMVLDVGFDFPYFLLPASDGVVQPDLWRLSLTTSFHYSIE